jgi:hypothetical protein
VDSDLRESKFQRMSEMSDWCSRTLVIEQKKKKKKQKGNDT